MTETSHRPLRYQYAAHWTLVWFGPNQGRVIMLDPMTEHNDVAPAGSVWAIRVDDTYLGFAFPHSHYSQALITQWVRDLAPNVLDTLNTHQWLWRMGKDEANES